MPTTLHTGRAKSRMTVFTDIYVELCDEARTDECDERKCSNIKKAMYGTQAAPHSWQRRVKDVMRRVRLKVGLATHLALIMRAKACAASYMGTVTFPRARRKPILGTVAI